MHAITCLFLSASPRWWSWAPRQSSASQSEPGIVSREKENVFLTRDRQAAFRRCLFRIGPNCYLPHPCQAALTGGWSHQVNSFRLHGLKLNHVGKVTTCIARVLPSPEHRTPQEPTISSSADPWSLGNPMQALCKTWWSSKGRSWIWQAVPLRIICLHIKGSFYNLLFRQ